MIARPEEWTLNRDDDDNNRSGNLNLRSFLSKKFLYYGFIIFVVTSFVH